MKFVLYTNSISAHQLPLAREIVKRVGADNFRYIYTGDKLQGGGQEVAASEPWIIKKDETVHSTTTTKDYNSSLWLESCDVLLSGIRDFDLFERRCAAGLKTYYTSERWFKPISIGVGSRCRCSVPGWVRMLYPRFLKMAQRMRRLIRMHLDHFTYLPTGVWAARDMARAVGFASGDIRCLFRLPSCRFDARPFGAIQNYPWMKMWGYFVAPSGQSEKCKVRSDKLRVLWVGRMIGWKRVDTIIKAVRMLGDGFELTLVGGGAESDRLVRLAAGARNIFFKDAVPISYVRQLMREHDIYVLSSNAQEGWGAALNEALEEGLRVIGTYEAGASATLLSHDSLFRAGDYMALAERIRSLSSDTREVVRGAWSAASAAQNMLEGLR